MCRPAARSPWRSGTRHNEAGTPPAAAACSQTCTAASRCPPPPLFGNCSLPLIMFICSSVCPFVCLSIQFVHSQFICLTILRYVRPFVHLLSVYLFIYSPVHFIVCLSVYLFIWSPIIHLFISCLWWPTTPLSRCSSSHHPPSLCSTRYTPPSCCWTLPEESLAWIVRIHPLL